jgi:hypothetical protein
MKRFLYIGDAGMTHFLIKGKQHASGTTQYRKSRLAESGSAGGE